MVVFCDHLLQVLVFQINNFAYIVISMLIRLISSAADWNANSCFYLRESLDIFIKGEKISKGSSKIAPFKAVNPVVVK